MTPARRGHFWIGVDPRETPWGVVPSGQMYVEWLAPEEATRRLPIVLVHGGGGQGLDWLGTPDGRPGWAQQLTAEGFEVYVVDRPGHGRASYHAELLGPPLPPASYPFGQDIFVHDPESELGRGHTQWPGGREPGDPVMDQLMAGMSPMRADFAAAHELDGDRLALLLDRIGEAIVFTHSAGGPPGFVAADRRPDEVAALLAIEPMGPPFLALPEAGVKLTWGLAAAPLTYAPAVADPADLEDGGSRTLPNLARTPIAVVAADHSLVGQASPAVA